MFALSIRRRPLDFEKALEFQFQHAPDLSQSRRRTYLLALKNWRRFGGPEDVRQVTTESYVTVRKGMFDSGLRPTSIEHYLTAISALIRHCGPRSGSCPHGLGLIREVPYIGRRLRQDSVIRPAVSLQVLSKMYEYADAFRFAPGGMPPVVWWRCFLVVAYNTGLRIGDLLALRWSAIVESERKIVCRASKTSKLHELPINDVVSRHLDMLPRENETGTRRSVWTGGLHPSAASSNLRRDRRGKVFTASDSPENGLRI